MNTSKVSTSQEWVEVIPGMKEPINARNIVVYLDDKDVTGDCFFAKLPGAPGVRRKSKVKLFLKDADGKRYFKNKAEGIIASKTLKGTVWWEHKGGNK